MSSQFLLLLIAILAGFALLYLLLKRQLELLQPKPDTTLLEWLKTTQSDLQKLQHHLTDSLATNNQSVTTTLQHSYKQLHERLEKATLVIGELKQETGKFSEIGRSMKDLQDFLNSPKLRGAIGEQVLTDLLKQTLPHQSFKTQYRFKDGSTVDAVIKTNAGLIPIDSKFPMENFTRAGKETDPLLKDRHLKVFLRDVKKHIATISKKYIKTEENTLDFALMYIPSESVYYEMTADPTLLQDYAQHKRVLPVSPATFYAFLRTILVSFEGQRIAKEAQLILKNLRDIQKSSQEFGDHLGTLQRHIQNANNGVTGLTTEFQTLSSKIDRTAVLDAPDPPLLED